MIRALRQKNLSRDGGDCFSTCVAMVLDLPQESVPNFCTPVDGWWERFQAWLDETCAMTAAEVSLTSRSVSKITPGVPCVMSGDSPAGDWLHSVVAVTTDEGFEYLHDPNPSDAFLRGEPLFALFFVPLRPDLARKK